MIDIQMSIYEKLQFSSQQFYLKWKLGDLMTRLFSDSFKVREIIMLVFSKFIPEVLSLVGVFIYFLNIQQGSR